MAWRISDLSGMASPLALLRFFSRTGSQLSTLPRADRPYRRRRATRLFERESPLFPLLFYATPSLHLPSPFAGSRVLFLSIKSLLWSLRPSPPNQDSNNRRFFEAYPPPGIIILFRLSFACRWVFRKFQVKLFSLSLLLDNLFVLLKKSWSLVLEPGVNISPPVFPSFLPRKSRLCPPVFPPPNYPLFYPASPLCIIV